MSPSSRLAWGTEADRSRAADDSPGNRGRFTLWRLLSVTVPLSCSAFGISTMEFPVMAMLMTPPDPPEVGGVTGQGPLITFEMTTFG